MTKVRRIFYFANFLKRNFVKNLLRVCKYQIFSILRNKKFFKKLYPRAESNRNRQNRNLKFYPLNYRGDGSAKV